MNGKTNNCHWDAITKESQREKYNILKIIFKTKKKKLKNQVPNSTNLSE